MYCFKNDVFVLNWCSITKVQEESFKKKNQCLKQPNFSAPLVKSSQLLPLLGELTYLSNSKESKNQWIPCSSSID